MSKLRKETDTPGMNKTTLHSTIKSPLSPKSSRELLQNLMEFEESRMPSDYKEHQQPVESRGSLVNKSYSTLYQTYTTKMESPVIRVRKTANKTELVNKMR